MWNRYPPRAADRTSVVYLGESAALHDICDWAMQHGIDPIDAPDSDCLCAIVDQYLLDGPNPPYEDWVLRQLWRDGVPSFTPERAWPVLSSAVNRGLAGIPSPTR